MRNWFSLEDPSDCGGDDYYVMHRIIASIVQKNGKDAIKDVSSVFVIQCSLTHRLCMKLQSVYVYSSSDKPIINCCMTPNQSPTANLILGINVL